MAENFYQFQSIYLILCINIHEFNLVSTTTFFLRFRPKILYRLIQYTSIMMVQIKQFLRLSKHHPRQRTLVCVQHLWYTEQKSIKHHPEHNNLLAPNIICLHYCALPSFAHKLFIELTVFYNAALRSDIHFAYKLLEIAELLWNCCTIWIVIRNHSRIRIFNRCCWWWSERIRCYFNNLSHRFSFLHSQMIYQFQ